MGELPDELWVQILQSGVRNGKLQCRDLCTLAIVSSRMSRICGLGFFWKELVASDFPQLPLDDASLGRPGSSRNDGDWKGLYKLRFEKVTKKKLAAHMWKVLRMSSSLLVLQRDCEHLKRLIRDERNRLISSQKELADLDRTSRTSVALQIWQPHAVSTQHEQVVEQVSVNHEAQRNYLVNEIADCTLRMRRTAKTLKLREYLVDESQAELDALKYNPTQDLLGSKDNPLTDRLGNNDVLETKSRKRKRSIAQMDL